MESNQHRVDPNRMIHYFTLVRPLNSREQLDDDDDDDSEMQLVRVGFKCIFYR
jgi:hypothetical protein